MEGAIYQMFSHGVSTGALFMLVGMLYERRHTRLISEFGGLATSVPVYSTFFLIVVLSSLGLPLLNGFVGEFLIIVGSYYSHAVLCRFRFRRSGAGCGLLALDVPARVLRRDRRMRRTAPCPIATFARN